MTAKLLRQLFLLSLLALALSCGSMAYHRAVRFSEQDNLDQAVANLKAAVKANPNSIKYKTTLVRTRFAASQKHVEAAKRALARRELTKAADELMKALKLDPGNQYARDTLARVLATAKAEEKKSKAPRLTIAQMKKEAEKKSGVPKLSPDSNIPIVLKFKNTSLKTILEAISKASGINFLYDERANVNKKVSVDFAKVRLEQVLNYLMMQSKNFYKVLDPHSIIIVPDNRQKRAEYEDQVIQTFYLSNANVKDVFQLVRSILQIRKMAMNQKLNSITIQDTPERVAIAQKIIENNDKSKGEVVVDVELLEVDSFLTRDLGIDLSSKTFMIGPKINVQTTDNGTAFGDAGPIPLNELGRTLGHALFVAPIPNLIVNMLLTNSDSQVLAQPQLRVMEGEKAMVHIGDRIPIPTSQSYLPSQGTTSYTPLTSYTYQDTGVKIQVEPRVHFNREVTLKLKVEVSAINGYIQSGNSLSGKQPIISTREMKTVIRLKDGETSLLAGLIKKNGTTTLSGIPGLSEVPFLRRLFSNTTREKKSTDVVMLVTPHIVRMPNITEQNLEPLFVGTKDNPHLSGSEGSPFAGPSRGPFEQAPVAETPTPGGQESKKKPEKPQAPSGRLLLSPTTIEAAPGDPVVLNLVIIGAKAAKGMTTKLSFSPGILKYQGTEEGAFFKLGGGTTTFSGQESGPGAVVLNVTRGTRSGASGSGLVARISFTAGTVGESKIALSSAKVLGLAGQSAPMASTFAMVVVRAKKPKTK